MRVVRAAVLGYCMGVERAVKLAQKVLEQSSEGKENSVFALGPLIHNPVVLRSLKERGLTCIDEDKIESLPKRSKVIIRAHGVPPWALEKARAQNLELYDATCPKVAVSRKKVVSLSREGKTIIFAGDKNHGEVLSIVGFAKKENPSVSLFVVQNTKEAREVPLLPATPAVLVSQTTFSPVELEKIEAVLKEKCPALEVHASICSATRERQEALYALRGTVEAVIVIGGKNSANTKRLSDLAKTFCKNVALIEDVSEIPADFFTYTSVALTAGASTPLSLVDQVEAALKASGKVEVK